MLSRNFALLLALLLFQFNCIMEPVVHLKRPTPVSIDECIICQETKRENLRGATPHGIQTVRETTIARSKCRDFKYRDTIDRLTSTLKPDSDHEAKLVWHKSCYSDYTHKVNISRLTKCHKTESVPSTSNEADSSRTLRSNSLPMDWSLCMFCQVTKHNQQVHTVRSENLSDSILSVADYVERFSIRVAGVHDLIAADGRYHLSCLQQYRRNTERATTEHTSVDLAMIWLGQELRLSSKRGHVLELEQVWLRYETLSVEANIEIPPSFLSRRMTFKDKLSTIINDVYECITMSDRQTILVPVKFSHIPFSQWFTNDHEIDDDQTQIPTFKAQDEREFLSMIHVALKLRSDILAHPTFSGVNISEDAAIDCIPPNLYMFLRLLLGGQALLENIPEEEEKPDEQEKQKECRVLSLAQDLVFSVTSGKKMTPKHIGLGSTLHQATRSKQLVELFHSAGHIISYRDILRIDTALAENTLKNMNPTNGGVIPANMVPGRFVHFSADNIDINDSTLDGKNTFHATQVAAWQRGPAPDNLLNNIVPSSQSTLQIPEVMEAIIPTNVVEGLNDPKLGNVKEEWFEKSADEVAPVIQANASDMAFTFIRQHEQPKPTWTSFNQTHSKVDPEKTTIGYMPIIQAPAHDMGTLNTVVKRVLYVAESLDQTHAVITVDQALFPLLMELKWNVPQYKDVLIPRLGGLHISMNFLKLIGQHTQDSGLADAWVESGILGPISMEKAMSGKSYAKGIRAHKLTLQCLWNILLPQLLSYMEEHDNKLKEDIEIGVYSGNYESLVTTLSSEEFRSLTVAFIDSRAADPNMQYWWQYMNMLCILLQFIRAQRDGLWELHLCAFRQMLPFFHRYDHINYARWGCIYLAEMQLLPTDVKQEFEKGNFVVKGSSQKFNQVDPDHSQEWLNGIGKKGGGIIGITKTTSALSRWALSYNLRACIAAQTREMYLVNHDEMTHNETLPARMKRDNEDESKLTSVLRRFRVFSPETPSPILQNIATKDVATIEIQQSLLNAQTWGQQKLSKFVKERLTGLTETNQSEYKLRDPLKKSKAQTFASLYVVQKCTKSKEATMKVDRNILQRLITAYQAGRQVDLDQILHHELMPVPVSLANLDGSLKTGNKSTLADVLAQDITCPPEITIDGSSCLVIDGQALVLAVGKPVGVRNFDQLAKTFMEHVINIGGPYSRIDVTFDRYREISIKAGERQKRSKQSRLIRRVIEDGTVPVPNNWADFIAMPANKADLACYLSNYIVTNAPADKTIVVSGGFQSEDEVQTTNSELNVDYLQATHEEADTRIILHCMHSDAENIVVSARDTDVLILLVAHFHRLNCRHLWMRAGTAKRRKYIPVHDIRRKLSLCEPDLETLLPFHAITGCDTVSHISGHGKSTAWKVFTTDHHLLTKLGKGELTEEIIRSVEQFVCKLYNEPDARCCDEARVKLFYKSKSPEALPPTSDAVRFHIQRAHYQSMVWRQAVNPRPVLPSPLTMGWAMAADGQLSPKLMSLTPIPEACIEIVKCGCTKGCVSRNCTCRKGQLTCTGACKCTDGDVKCRNRHE